MSANPNLSMPEYTGPALGPSEHGHPSDLQYIGIAVALAIVTALEVGLYYWKSLDTQVNSILLLLMAGLKFFVVAAFFMHLKFDNQAFRRLFVGGGVLAGFCYLAVLSAFGVFRPLVMWIVFAVVAAVLLSVGMVRWTGRGAVEHEGHGHESHDHDHAGHDHADPSHAH